MPNADAQMAKLVDALVSGASAARLAGSTPVLGTERGRVQKLFLFSFIPPPPPSGALIFQNIVVTLHLQTGGALWKNLC